jgi:hypothetical protein
LVVKFEILKFTFGGKILKFAAFALIHCVAAEILSRGSVVVVAQQWEAVRLRFTRRFESLKGVSYEDCFAALAVAAAAAAIEGVVSAAAAMRCQWRNFDIRSL